MEIPKQATYGKTVPLRLTLQNVGDERAAYVIGGNPSHDFVITTPDGDGVWNWNCAKVGPDVLYGSYLKPGEEIECVEEWQQVNVSGEPVPPGAYLVCGTLHIGPYESFGDELYQLETKPHRLEILKR